MRSSQLLRFSLVAACSLFAGCSDGTGPTPFIPATLDEVLAETGASTSFASGLTLRGGVLPASAPTGAGACAYNATSQFFVCPGQTAGGITYNWSYQLLDATNAALSAFAPTTVAAVRTVSDFSGSAAETGATVAMQGHEDQTLSGLLTSTHTLNGQGTTSETVTLTGSSPITLNMTQTTTNLVLPRRGTADKYPRSGSIDLAMTSSDAQFTFGMKMIFDGTSVVKVDFTTLGTVQHCTLDLAKSASEMACTG